MTIELFNVIAGFVLFFFVLRTVYDIWMNACRSYYTDDDISEKMKHKRKQH